MAEVQRRQVDGASVVRQVRVAAHALLKHALGELNQDLDVLQAQAQGHTHRQARSWHSRRQGSTAGREQEENTVPTRAQQGGGTRTLRWGASTSTQSCKRCSKCRMKPMLSLVAEVLICSQRVCERGTGSVSTRRTTHQPVNDERQLLGRCRRHKIIGRCHALVCQLVDRKRQRVLGHVPMHCRHTWFISKPPQALARATSVVSYQLPRPPRQPQLVPRAPCTPGA